MAKLFRKRGSRHWWITYIGHDGKRRRKSAKTSDKSTASQVMAALEKTEVQKELGVYTDSHELAKTNQARPLQEHIDDFAKTMRTESVGAKHVADQQKKLEKLASECDWGSLSEIDSQSLVDWMDEHSSMADRTRQSYGTLAKQFTKWATRHKRLLNDPLTLFLSASIRERAFTRRALREDEFAYLKTHLLTSSDEVNGLSPFERSTLYELAIVTGLRVGEIGSLTVTSLSLEAKRPFLRVRATATKNGKTAEQSLTRSLVRDLGVLIAKKTPRAPLFSAADSTRLAKMLRGDCEAGRSGWLAMEKKPSNRNEREQSDFLSPTNHDGERLDFHCLRHTCGAWLALRGVHPKAIQSTMRHSSIRLTLDTYGHLFPEQRDDVIAALEQATSPKPRKKSNCAL